MDMTNFGQTIPDIPRFSTALAEWLSCILMILVLKHRMAAWKLAVLFALFLPVQASFLILTDHIEGAGWFLCMAAAIMLMFLFIFCSCRISPLGAGFYCVQAFVLAEFAASLEWQIHSYVTVRQEASSLGLTVFILLFIYGVTFSIMFFILRQVGVPKESLKFTLKEFFLAAIIGLSVFLVSNLGFVPVRTSFGGEYISDINSIRTLVDFGGVAILMAYYIQRVSLRARYEVETLESILQNQYQQYQQAQEAQDIISFKYHDLKHHIIALKAEENAEKRNAYLDRMEQEIKTYESQNKTGNRVLDTFLNSKSLYCAKNHISLTSVADGALLDFMDIMDICSIFGNALDNAIEYEMQLSDEEKRLIHLSVFSQKRFLIIRVENYYEGEKTPDKELLKISKKDNQFHGYGLKSIRHTVHKYNGEVDVTIQKGWFHLRILIPLV